MKLTSEQLGRLLHKAAHEPRRNQKRYLKDLGGEGSAEELDWQLELAAADAAAQAEAARLEKQRHLAVSAIELGVEGRVTEMLAELRSRMEEQGLTQTDVAERCGWQQPLVSAYLAGKKEPGAGNLAKLAAAVGCAWRLQPSPVSPETGEGR